MVFNRDYIIELLPNASIGMMHLLRFKEDLICFNAVEINFIKLGDELTFRSSLMLQKKLQIY
ncbi:hypothetical protein FD727_03090 [Pantoea sp. Mhis]|nr:hypothetical protein [Pantoea sp. Mhis]